MMPHLVRVLRTASSERYVIQRRPNEDAAALDLHFLADGSIAGTLFLFEDGGLSESEVPALLRHVDETLLPHAGNGDDRLTFTVVRGRVLGAFGAERSTDAGH